MTGQVGAHQRLIHDPAMWWTWSVPGGKGFDSAVAEAFVDASGEVLRTAEQSAWEGVLAAALRPRLELCGDGIDRRWGAQMRDTHDDDDCRVLVKRDDLSNVAVSLRRITPRPVA